MTDTFPSAEAIATAIVVACRATKEDPLACANGVHCIRGRYYAFAGLLLAFPDTAHFRLARYVGSRSSASFRANVETARSRSHWWDASIEAAVIAALGGPRQRLPKIVAPAVERKEPPQPRVRVHTEPRPSDPPVPPAPKFVPRADPRIQAVARGARVIDRRYAGTVNMGEPAPGRSALDQRRAAEAASVANANF